MRLTYLLAAGASLLAALAAPSAQEVVTALGQITVKQRQLIPEARSITILNAPLMVIGQGPFPHIITGVMGVSTDIHTLASQLGDANYSGDEKDAIVVAFTEFSKTQGEFASILIGKATILDKVPLVGQPLEMALGGLDAADDTLIVALVNHLDDSGAVVAEGDSLGNTLQEAINKYRSIIA